MIGYFARYIPVGVFSIRFAAVLDPASQRLSTRNYYEMNPQPTFHKMRGLPPFSKLIKKSLSNKVT